MEELFLERPLSNQETGGKPVAEGMIMGSDTQAACGPLEMTQTILVMTESDPPSFRRTEMAPTALEAATTTNNTTGFGHAGPKQRRRVLSLSIDITTLSFGIPNPDTDRHPDGLHLAKLQRPYLSYGR